MHLSIIKDKAQLLGSFTPGQNYGQEKALYQDPSPKYTLG